MRVSNLVPWRSNPPTRRAGGEAEDTFDLMRREMNQLFTDFFQGLESTGEGGAFNPRVNVAETETEFETTVELPGLSEKDIELTLTREGLLIKGEKKAEKEEEGKNYYRRERTYGSFQRQVPLPVETIDRDNVEAQFEHGILTVTLPKREAVQPTTRKIPVQSG